MKYGITIENCQLDADHSASIKCPDNFILGDGGICVCNTGKVGPDCRSIYNYIIIIIM